jgi:hypothetical protein
MKKWNRLVAAAFLAATAPVAALAQTSAVVAPVVVTGEVVRYEPGRVLVVKGLDGREVSYTLTAQAAVPAEVQVGRTVSVLTERGADGTAAVTRVTTTSITPEGQVKRSTEETRVEPGGVIRQNRHTTVSGEVVSYTPGTSIVVRDATGQQTTFTLTPKVGVPAEVQVGKRVTLHTEPGADGTTTVARVTTTTITPEGEMKRTVEETRTAPGGQSTKTTTVSVQGTVQAFVPGKSLTVQKSDGTRVLYVIGEGTTLPADVAVGKVVSIRSLPVVETVVIEKQQ